MMQRTQHILSVAPMMGYTDRHCRFLLRLLSANAMLYSEMLMASALTRGDRGRLLRHRGDEPCAVQLGGSDPAELAAAARLVEAAGYQEVNLNCGCPSDRVQRGAAGACLMAAPELVAECCAAMRDAVSIPVTIKCRIGVNERDDYAFFHRFISACVDAGCAGFQVHARKAVLGGLSPKENRAIPPLNYDQVRRIRQDFPDAGFVLNGGIRTVGQATALAEEFHGVMLGRAISANPWLLAELEQALFGAPLPDRAAVLAAWREYMAEELRAGVQLKAMARHLLGFFAGIPGARAFRRHLGAGMHANDAGLGLIDEALELVGRAA